ncbi:DUF4870 domain-containing protein [Ferroplasma acidiphilum]|uniref:DUF4870 domain-containing protein n=1 Tax=Ferroplasma acidiphilum TaxID=74969 RepID=UPI0023F4399B|nr:hypothetical protein [Ferroplasma acidiphilum]WMT53916.1 MAG: hypothetical protein RE473_03470 [Ferroplasma acidiphilum]
MEHKENNIMFIVAYLIPLITGLLVYILYGSRDSKLRFQSIQAILLGICLIVASIIFGIFDIFITGVAGQVISGILDLILVLVWLYGIYTGYRASRGMNANIPYLSDYASKL